MKHIKLETLATLGEDFITKSNASIEWNKEDNTKRNSEIFELDIIKSIIQNANKQNANKQNGIDNIYKLTITAKKNCTDYDSMEFILINLPLDIKIDDGLFLYRDNIMFNQMDGITTLNRTFVFKPDGRVYNRQDGQIDHVKAALGEINRKVKSEFKYLYYLFHEGKIEFTMN